ncbi:gallidermin/nisin family lantibiotic [Clostridium beijerinckii]|nr:gallidermin/nisin family lantibiotic [Clostridium beijerinckii]
MIKLDDFDLKIKKDDNKTGKVTPQVNSRYACTPGSCWKWVCFTTTAK